MNMIRDTRFAIRDTRTGANYETIKRNQYGRLDLAGVVSARSGNFAGGRVSDVCGGVDGKFGVRRTADDALEYSAESG
jgi:hypothetical protein